MTKPFLANAKVVLATGAILFLSNGVLLAAESDDVGNSLRSTILPDSAYNQPITSRKMYNDYYLAALDGDPSAETQIGLAHCAGRFALSDYREAAFWLEKAARKNQPIALYKLGRLYELGLGLPINEIEAAKLYQRGADLGNTDAQCALGDCYMNGKGVPQNFSSAMDWYTRAAKQGHCLALYRLGSAYFTGNNYLIADKSLSYAYLSLAATHSGRVADEARVKLNWLANHMSHNQIAEGERKAISFSQM